MAVVPILVFTSVWVVVALVLPFFVRGDMPRWARRGLHIAGGFSALGGLIFFVPLIINAGSLLPDSVEWPIGGSVTAVETESGHLVVSHMFSGRVQVYDEDLQFIRGWHVDADGGVIQLSVPSGQGDVVDVYTPRTKQRSRYALDGSLVADGLANTAGSSQAARREVSVPTKWWQLPLAYPAAGFALIFPGIIANAAIIKKFGASILVRGFKIG